MADFLSMGGYAFFVWTSMAITGVVLVANLAWAMLNHRRQLCRIARRVRRENRTQ